MWVASCSSSTVCPFCRQQIFCSVWSQITNFRICCIQGVARLVLPFWQYRSKVRHDACRSRGRPWDDWLSTASAWSGSIRVQHLKTRSWRRPYGLPGSWSAQTTIRMNRCEDDEIQEQVCSVSQSHFSITALFKSVPGKLTKHEKRFAAFS